MTQEPSTHALLIDLERGEAGAADRLFQRVYDELRSLARHYLRNQPNDQTLQPTALVHEAYIKLIGSAPASYADRAHFRAVAAKAMRNLFIDHVRSGATRKRGGDVKHVILDEGLVHADDREVDLAGLNDALTRLSELDPRKSQIVILRFFGGLTSAETAHVLGIARSTVAEDWRMARAWLAAELRDDAADEPAES